MEKKSPSRCLMTGLSGAQIQHKRKAPYLRARPIAHPPRRPAVGRWRPAPASSEGDNVVWKVIKIGNVPAMWNRRASQIAKEPDAFLVLLTAPVMGASLGGFLKCRSISSHFPIKEKFLEHCTKIALGSFISKQPRKKSYQQTVSIAAVCLCLFFNSPHAL